MASLLQSRILQLTWKALSWAVVAVAAAAIAAAVAILIVPKALGWEGVVVLSGSMEPELQTGGMAFIEKTDPATIKEGDIITFRPFFDQANMVTHRVIAITRNENGLLFTTKGDANSDIDLNPVSANDVVGKVRLDLPYVGHLVDRLHDRQSYYLIVGIPAALLILNEIGSLYTEFRRWRGRKQDQVEAEGAAS